MRKIKKYKEIIISLSIIAIVTRIIGINFYINYKKDIKISNEEQISTEEIKIEPNSYYIQNGKLYISYDGKEKIKVPGSFENQKELEKGTYQISLYKTIFTYNTNNKICLVYSDDSGKTWNTIETSKEGTVKYIEFFDQSTGIMYNIEDVAMTLAFGTISKTNNGGITWESVSNGINDTFRLDSEVKFFNENFGFVTIPNNGGSSCELYNTQDGGKTFNKVQVDYIELEDTDLKWNEIYDYYNIPIKTDYSYYLNVGQGADGDYKGGNTIQYNSYDGIMWTISDLH